ncbi:MAG: PAS domain S-box protein [Candidatus Hydrogenedentes bacterium]|nr:PAS domain S-box protein [Candidatus Hydrogenedentota bacterium]
MAILDNALLEEKRRTEAALAYRLAFEQLVTRLSTRFIQSSARELDEAITWALRQLGEFTHVDRCVVFQMLGDSTNVHFTHEWCAPDFNSTQYRYATVPMDTFPWAYEMYRKFQVVYVSDVDELPAEAWREQEMWRAASVQSVLAVPLSIGKELQGVIALTTEREKKLWMEEDIRLLETAAQMVMNAISRQKSEAALHRMEAQFRTLADQLPAAIAILNSGRFVYVNEASERLSGYSRNEITALDLSAFLHPEDREVGLQILDSVSPDELARGAEARFIDRTGEERWVEVQARRIEFGGKDSFLVAAIDTTERHKAAEALRRSEEHLRSVLQNMPVMMSAFDERGNIIVWNREAERVTGYASPELVGNPHAMGILYPDPSYRARVVVEWAERGADYRDQEWNIACKDGTVRTVSWFNISATFPIPGWASWGIGVDVTDRRKLERQVLEISAREQMRIGQDLHDRLGQHLTGIGFKSQVLAEDLQAKHVAEATTASTIVEMVSDAINQTRGLARGLYPVHLEADGLMTALHELAAQTQSLFNIRCKFVCEEPILIYDVSVATHLYRIAQEALNNAVRHGKPKAIEIVLHGDGDDVELRIADDGTGIDLVSNGNQGLGLNIMQYRARMIDGTLRIQRGDRGGTIVTCSLTVPAPGEFVESV